MYKNLKIFETRKYVHRYSIVFNKREPRKKHQNCSALAYTNSLQMPRFSMKNFEKNLNQIILESYMTSNALLMMNESVACELVFKLMNNKNRSRKKKKKKKISSIN